MVVGLDTKSDVVARQRSENRLDKDCVRPITVERFGALCLVARDVNRGEFLKVNEQQLNFHK